MSDMPIAATLTERDLAAGFEPSVGDTVILSDLARCQPQRAIALENVKGKWWLRRYTTESGSIGNVLSSAYLGLSACASLCRSRRSRNTVA